MIIASRNAANGKKAVDEVKSAGGTKASISDIQLDVTDSASIERAAQDVEKEFGRLDVLVNNAGVHNNNPDLDLKTELEQTFRTNAVGAIMVTQAFTPLLLKSKNPYSIYVSSSMGSLNLAEDTNFVGYNISTQAYRMSKSALNMWAVQEARLMSEKGLKTFVMCPGFVVSNLRGKSEEARTGGGYASDPRVSGETILSIIEGKRDADVGKFVHKDGLYEW